MREIKLCKSFKFLSVSAEKNANTRLKERGISLTQGIVLLWLSDEKTGELPVKTIEKRFGTAQSTTLGVVNRLEQKGLVTTCLSGHQKLVRNTPAGGALVAVVRRHMQEADDQLFQGFTPGEKIMFLELLRRMEYNMLKQQGIEMERYYHE